MRLGRASGRSETSRKPRCDSHERRRVRSREKMMQFVKVTAALCGALLLGACQNSDSTATSGKPGAHAANAGRASFVDREGRCLRNSRRSSQVSRRLMNDLPDKHSAGTMLLTAWAARRMRWGDVAVEKDETTTPSSKKTPTRSAVNGSARAVRSSRSRRWRQRTIGRCTAAC